MINGINNHNVNKIVTKLDNSINMPELPTEVIAPTETPVETTSLSMYDIPSSLIKASYMPLNGLSKGNDVVMQKAEITQKRAEITKKRGEITLKKCEITEYKGLISKLKADVKSLDGDKNLEEKNKLNAQISELEILSAQLESQFAEFEAKTNAEIAVLQDELNSLISKLPMDNNSFEKNINEPEHSIEEPTLPPEPIDPTDPTEPVEY